MLMNLVSQIAEKSNHKATPSLETKMRDGNLTDPQSED